MDEPTPMTGPDVTPSWRQEPRGQPDEVQARRLKSKTWTLFAVLAVALGALLGLASSFRSRPYPAFLPLVVFLVAPARVGPGGVIEILGTGAKGDGPDRWMALREILAKVSACPARN